MSVAPSPPASAPANQGNPPASNLFNRIFLIVVASVLLTALASLFVFAQLKDDVRGLNAALKTVVTEQLTTKDELEKRLSKEDLEKRLKADLETVAAAKKTLDELAKQHALDAKASKEELEKRLTKDDLEKRLKADLEALAAAKKALEDLTKQHASDVLAVKKEMESFAAKKDLETLATKQALKELADGTLVRKVRLERKDLEDALKYRGTLEEKDRKDHELVFSLNTTGGRGEVLVNIASNFSEIDHLTADSLPAEGKPFGVKLVFKNAVTEIPEKWFIELSVYRAGATEYKVVAGK
jgi:hypothetical protein